MVYISSPNRLPKEQSRLCHELGCPSDALVHCTADRQTFQASLQILGLHGGLGYTLSLDGKCRLDTIGGCVVLWSTN